MALNNKRTFYTDGACSGNPGPGGWAYVELNPLERTLVEYDFKNNIENTTNNRMELEAIINVCELISREIVPSNCVIYSDSAYCVNLINTWMWSWAKNGWRNSKNEEIANKDLVIKLYNFFSGFGGTFVKVEKICGHNNIIGNEIADRLATGRLNEVQALLGRENYWIDTSSVGFYRSLYLKNIKLREAKNI